MSGHSASRAAPPALERRLKYAGSALFSYGFRPFFLGGAAWSVAGIVLWIPQFTGELWLRTAYLPLDWHIHEMLCGYVGRSQQPERRGLGAVGGRTRRRYSAAVRAAISGS
jgi:hypothetical protein